MFLSKYSAKHMLFVLACAVALLFTLPYNTKAAESTVSSPDWINSSITATNVGEEAWSDARQAEYNNISCESKSAYSWGWQDNGWTRWRVKTLQNGCVTAGQNAYMDFSQILPLGSEYWQALDLKTDYYHAWPLPNAGTDGMAIITNAYADYANMPSELYYTNDVLSVFNKFSTDSAGNIVRSPSRAFEHKLTYPDGRAFPVNNVGDISYSANGKWMYVNRPETAQLRINTSDFSVFSFGSGVNHTYALYTTTTNSGNTVATYSYGVGLKLYDLTNCESEKPDYGSRNCASRDATDVIQNATKSISSDTPVYVMGIKFQTESRLHLLLQYRQGDQVKAGFMDLEISAGEQPMRYLALGDSFSSGEGAYNYRSVTNFYADENNYNLCHQSLSSYSYLLKKSLSPDWFGSIACSGATQEDVVESSNLNYLLEHSQAQTPRSNKTEAYVNIVQQNVFPGYIPQLSFDKKYSPTVATISIGGNDIGFGDIVTACIVNKFFRNMQSCSTNRFDREQVANSIDAQIPKLVATLSSIKQNMAGEQKLYVVGYPKIVNYTNMLCSLNTPMDQNEREFADNLVDYLNEAIRIAATQAGAKFLDMSSAFVNSDHDYRLCGNDEQKAVNGLSTERNSNRKPEDLVAHESFHPNALGHSLLAQQIRLLTNDFTLKMPEPTRISSVPNADFRTRLVGDAIVTNTNQTVNYITDSIPNLVIGAGVQTLKIVASVPGTIAQNVTATIELHSTPVTIGQATVTTENTIDGTFTIPNTVSPGYHQLHVVYTDSTGQEYDLYKYVLVVASADDFDGDGVKNEAEACVVSDGSGVDSDNDGVDDACDGEYVASERDDSSAIPTEPSIFTGADKVLADVKLPKTNASSVGDEIQFENYTFSANSDSHQNIGDGLRKIASLAPISQGSAKNTMTLYRTIGIVTIILAIVCLCFMIVKKLTRH